MYGLEETGLKMGTTPIMMLMSIIVLQLVLVLLDMMGKERIIVNLELVSWSVHHLVAHLGLELPLRIPIVTEQQRVHLRLEVRK